MDINLFGEEDNHTGLTNLTLTVRFKNNSSKSTRIPSFYITEVLGAVERGIKISHKNQASSLLLALGIRDEMLDNAIHTSLEKVPSEFFVHRAYQGSIVLEGVLSTIGMWVILNTFGETFKDSWKETRMHQKFKELLSRDRCNYPVKYSKKIEGELTKSHLISSNSRVIVESNNEGIIININLRRSKVLLFDIATDQDIRIALQKAIGTRGGEEHVEVSK